MEFPENAFSSDESSQVFCCLPFDTKDESIVNWLRYNRELKLVLYSMRLNSHLVLYVMHDAQT